MYTFQLLKPLQLNDQYADQNQELHSDSNYKDNPNELEAFIKIMEAFLHTRLIGIEAVASGKVSDDSSL
jgi:hypothetical protein